MNGLCLTESLLYYATITCDKENYTKLYKGICETTFKRRYANHNKSFNIPAYKNDTELFCRLSVLCCLCFHCVLEPYNPFAIITFYLFLLLFKLLTHYLFAF